MSRPIIRAAILVGLAAALAACGCDGGKPEEMAAPAPSGTRHGLHGQRLTDTSRPGSEKPRRFVLPPGALA